MKELLMTALNRAELLEATYADIRILTTREQSVSVRNGLVESVSELENSGFGVRVLVNSAWGFASSATLTLREVERVAAEAVAIARASALYQQHRANLAPSEVYQAHYRTPITIDPFNVPIEEKFALLLEAEQLMRAEDSIKVTHGQLVCLRKQQHFASTEGASIEQELTETGGAIMALAIANGEVQRRSYPNVFRDQHAQGWEFIQALDFIGNAPRVGAEATALLSAEQCPTAVTTLILDRTQLGLQVHESCGHPTELDRVFGTEAAYAGTSFLTPEKLGVFRYGSELVNLTADATTPGGLGTFGYDDEGVPAQRIPLVQDGRFVGYLTSRETATQLAQLRGEDLALARSVGAMRASGWNRIPIIRMTNINLEPGDWDFQDLIADTDEGIYMETNKSWSIDNLRLNFLFGTELAYEIKGGKRGKLYKNATYTGMTPQFWGSCDAICNANHWGVWGVPNCGKGQPSQTAHTGHGAAPARFRNVRVGVMK